jgi:hypothetical protein
MMQASFWHVQKFELSGVILDDLGDRDLRIFHAAASSSRQLSSSGQ